MLNRISKQPAPLRVCHGLRGIIVLIVSPFWVGSPRSPGVMPPENVLSWFEVWVLPHHGTWIRLCPGVSGHSELLLLLFEFTDVVEPVVYVVRKARIIEKHCRILLLKNSS